MAISIKLDPGQVDLATKQVIEEQAKEIRSLKNKLQRAEYQLKQARSGMDMTKEARGRIKEVSEMLVGLLQDQGWADYDQQGL